MSKIKLLFKKIFQRIDLSGVSVFGRGQHFDWEMILICFLIIMVISVSFSVHVFLGVRAGDIFKTDFQAPVHNDTINKELLDKVIKDSESRAENLKKLQSERPEFIDPSL